MLKILNIRSGQSTIRSALSRFHFSAYVHVVPARELDVDADVPHPDGLRVHVHDQPPRHEHVDAHVRGDVDGHVRDHVDVHGPAPHVCADVHADDDVGARDRESVDVYLPWQSPFVMQNVR